MKFTRNASANWKGNIKEGKGTLSTQSKALDNTAYAFKTRFEQDPGTNPEELIGAAHAGCFTMKLTALLTEKGYITENIDTTAAVTFEDGKIISSALTVRAKVGGITAEQFEVLAGDAKETCPVSMLLNTNITLEAHLDT